MKCVIVTILLYIFSASSVAASSTSKDIIKIPTDIQILQYITYRESRGESVVTIRAVLDVVLNRSRKNRETIYVTIHKPSQFPYIKRTGVRRVKDKKFLQKFWKAFILSPVLTSEYLYFNHKPFKWGKNTRKIGGLYFSK